MICMTPKSPSGDSVTTSGFSHSREPGTAIGSTGVGAGTLYADSFCQRFPLDRTLRAIMPRKPVVCLPADP